MYSFFRSRGSISRRPETTFDIDVFSAEITKRTHLGIKTANPFRTSRFRKKLTTEIFRISIRFRLM